MASHEAACSIWAIFTASASASPVLNSSWPLIFTRMRKVIADFRSRRGQDLGHDPQPILR